MYMWTQGTRGATAMMKVEQNFSIGNSNKNRIPEVCGQFRKKFGQYLFPLGWCFWVDIFFNHRTEFLQPLCSFPWTVPCSLIHSTTIFVIRLHLEIFAWPDSPYVLVSLVLACPFSAVFWQSKSPISPPALLMVILQHLSLTIPLTSSSISRSHLGWYGGLFFNNPSLRIIFCHSYVTLQLKSLRRSAAGSPQPQDPPYPLPRIT